MRERFAKDSTDPEAARLAVQIAPYLHQKFAPTNHATVAHNEQVLLPLFDGLYLPRTSSLGKKEQAAIDAEGAGYGTDWGDDLATDAKLN